MPVTPQPQTLAEVLGGMFPAPALRMAGFTRHERGFVGYREQLSLPDVRTGDPVAFSGPDLDRYFGTVAFVDGWSWGSAYDDDPDPGQISGSMLEQAQFAANSSPYSQQMLGRVPPKTGQTAHSRSWISFEMHGRRLVCVRLSCRPAPASHQAIAARANTGFGLDLPVDLPLDVVGALTCFPCSTEAGIGQDVTSADSPDQLAAGLLVAAALAEGDLEKKMMMLRQY